MRASCTNPRRKSKHNQHATDEKRSQQPQPDNINSLSVSSPRSQYVNIRRTPRHNPPSAIARTPRHGQHHTGHRCAALSLVPLQTMPSVHDRRVHTMKQSGVVRVRRPPTETWWACGGSAVSCTTQRWEGGSGRARGERKRRPPEWCARHGSRHVGCTHGPWAKPRAHRSLQAPASVGTLLLAVSRATVRHADKYKYYPIRDRADLACCQGYFGESNWSCEAIVVWICSVYVLVAIATATAAIVIIPLFV